MKNPKIKSQVKLKLKKIEISAMTKAIGGGCYREGPHYVCCYQGDTWNCMGRPPAV